MAVLGMLVGEGIRVPTWSFLPPRGGVRLGTIADGKKFCREKYWTNPLNDGKNSERWLEYN